MRLTRFKQYNDVYGHAAGDDCRRTIIRAIRDLTPKRPGDLVARYEEEALAVLLPSTDVAVAEKIRHAIYNLRIEHAGSPAGFVTVSAGVDSLVPAWESDEPVRLIKALHAAKTVGRNRACSIGGTCLTLRPEATGRTRTFPSTIRQQMISPFC